MNTINLTENKKHIILHNIGDISIDYHIMTNIDYRSTINFPLITGGSTYVQEGGAWFTSFLLHTVSFDTAPLRLQPRLPGPFSPLHDRLFQSALFWRWYLDL